MHPVSRHGYIFRFRHCDFSLSCSDFPVNIFRSLDKTISSLEMELAVARTNQNGGQASPGRAAMGSNKGLQKAFVVVGINTAFSSKKRRDSIRETWMPKGP